MDKILQDAIREFAKSHGVATNEAIPVFLAATALEYAEITNGTRLNSLTVIRDGDKFKTTCSTTIDEAN